ncbi:glycosyltransferase [Microbacter sp. GSS18]|nr:glycosyltransferase [Microbacter sp. GSS18]
MTAILRVMLDQVTAPTDADLATGARDLARALIATAPEGCAVEGIAPAGGAGDKAALPGLVDLRRTALARRELAAALQMGVTSGIGGGMIHAPTLLAPLVRHDRVHDHDQTVVTVWDMRPWETPAELPKSVVAWHRAMLKRAARHADAIVVPTHAIGERLSGVARLGSRVRVIAGAPAIDLAVPRDEVGRRRSLGLPEGFVLLSGTPAPSDALSVGFRAVAASGVDVPLVVVDVPEGLEPAVAEIAAAAGIPERRLHVRGALETLDRGAVYGAALALLAPSRRAAFPWRVIDALALGVPVIASASAVHRDVVVDGGMLVDAADDAALAEGMGEGLAQALSTTRAAERWAVLAADRGRAFSWHGAAERVWQLHADL